MLRPAELFYLGPNAAEITPYEKDVLKNQSITCIPLEMVRHNPAKAAQQAKQWGARFDRLLVHLDTDVLSYTQFPVAENVRRSNGLTLGELTGILAILASAPNVRALTVTEANPDHAPDEEEIFRELIGALSSSLAQ